MITKDLYSQPQIIELYSIIVIVVVYDLKN